MASVSTFIHSPLLSHADLAMEQCWRLRHPSETLSSMLPHLAPRTRALVHEGLNPTFPLDSSNA